MSDNNASECFKWLVFELEKHGQLAPKIQEALDEIEKAVILAENVRCMNSGTGIVRSDYFVEKAHGEAIWSYGRLGLCDCKSRSVFSSANNPDGLFHNSKTGLVAATE